MLSSRVTSISGGAFTFLWISMINAPPEHLHPAATNQIEDFVKWRSAAAATLKRKTCSKYSYTSLAAD
jgi:hypothetical protein